ncbi:hypothetical protein AB0C29_07135 [Actinoplanes sp. NPDC048791]|uniref:hypothetical protein n=1 Tax=Actinoplanes sp. NPDC048791 TaxID=3154623 RepID=UPI00340CCC53
MGVEFESSGTNENWSPWINGPPESSSTPDHSTLDDYSSPGIIQWDPPEIQDPSESAYDGGVEAAARATEAAERSGSVVSMPGDGRPEPQTEITAPGSGDSPPERREARSGVPDSAVEFINSAVKSLAWQAVESASAALSPLGPVVVRSLYIVNQIDTMIEGTRSGAGFDLKVSIPGLEFSIDELDAKLEVLARLHVGGPPSGGPTAGTLLEVQFYEPPTGRGDVGPHLQTSDTSGRFGIPPVHTDGGTLEDDRWGAWLDLVGELLIRNLSWALTYVASLPAGTVLASIKIGAPSARPPLSRNGS